MFLYTRTITTFDDEYIGMCHKLFIGRSSMKLKMGINCFVSSSMRENPVEVGGEEGSVT